jgi:hypothetical protein
MYLVADMRTRPSHAAHHLALQRCKNGPGIIVLTRLRRVANRGQTALAGAHTTGFERRIFGWWAADWLDCDRVFVTGETVSGFEVDSETPASPGVRRSWLTGFFPVFDESGTVIQVGATVVEQHGPQACRGAATRERGAGPLATEKAEIGFWDVDEVNHVLHWPPLVKAMFGISADRPVSMADFYAGLHPEDGTQLPPPMPQLPIPRAARSTMSRIAPSSRTASFAGAPPRRAVSSTRRDGASASSERPWTSASGRRTTSGAGAQPDA